MFSDTEACALNIYSNTCNCLKYGLYYYRRCQRKPAHHLSVMTGSSGVNQVENDYAHLSQDLTAGVPRPYENLHPDQSPENSQNIGPMTRDESARHAQLGSEVSSGDDGDLTVVDNAVYASHVAQFNDYESISGANDANPTLAPENNESSPQTTGENGLSHNYLVLIDG